MPHCSEPPSPWEGYKLCLSDLPDCSHVLIVQDDALPALNFVPAVERIAARIADAPVCLFLSAVPSSAAAKARTALKLRPYRRYLPLGPSPFMPLVAVLWPKALAEDFLAWGLVNKTTRADDGNAGRWMRERKVGVLVSVPSLVEHDDSIDSVKGARRATRGLDRTRVAALLAEDALAYEW